MDREHQQLKSQGFVQPKWRGHVLTLQSFTLGAPRVEGHLFEISCHNSATCRNGQGAHKDGEGFLHQKAPLMVFFGKGSWRRRWLLGAEHWASQEQRSPGAHDPGAGLSSEDRPVFPQWGPKEKQALQQKNAGQKTYWSPWFTRMRNKWTEK